MAPQPSRHGRNRYSVISDGLPSQIPDVDPQETSEWLESFDAGYDDYIQSWSTEIAAAL